MAEGGDIADMTIAELDRLIARRAGRHWKSTCRHTAPGAYLAKSTWRGFASTQRPA